MQNNTLNAFNALMQCDPAHCVKEQCPNYFAEVGKCDAQRVIDMVHTILTQKFEGKETYKLYDEE